MDKPEEKAPSTTSLSSKDVDGTIAWPLQEDEEMVVSTPPKHDDTILHDPKVHALELTRTLSHHSIALSPPPDGGRQAWTQVALVHLTIFSTWGWITSYGVFQEYYRSTLHISPSAISWVGSLQIFLLFFLGTWSGRALDAGYFRHVYACGSVLQILGVFGMASSRTYWQVLLSQGVCCGVANGLQFCPAMGLMSTYFARKRALAAGLTALGSCTGGVVFAVLVQQLLPKIGFAWTIRICGFIMVGTNAITLAFFRTRLPPRKAGPIVEWAALREATLVLYCAAMFFNFWGLYFAFFYVGSYGRNTLGMSYPDSISLLLAMVSIGFLWRIVPNYFADKVGPLNVMMPFAAVCGIMMFAWTGVTSRATLFIFATIYGSGAAGMQSMFPAGLASLTDDLKKAGVRMGMGFTIVSFACLSGPPLAGALIQANDGKYLYAQIWGGLSFCVGTSLLFAARTAKVGLKLRRKI